MFFKRKNINPELQQKVAEAEEQQKPQQQDLTPTVTLDVQVSTEATETFQERRKLEAEAKEHAVEEAKKQLEQELAVKHYYHQRLLETLDLGLLASLEKDRARKELHDAIVQLMADDQTHALSAEGRKRVIQQIEDEVFGLGPLEPLLNDPTVSDILVNGPKHVFVERRGKLELTPYTFLDERHLRNIIDRVVSQVGRRIDEASPMVDARLIDGSRVNAIIPPLALDGSSVSIRRFAVEKLNMDNLLNFNSLSPEMAKFVEAAVRGAMNVLISGGTGSGKTTTLNIFSNFIPSDDRIVTIEDSAELQLQQPHVVRLETRPANLEGKGEITQRDLVKNSLRMRPDRIVLGEVRGAEAVDMLAAMNTGHDGSLATIHANTPRDALSRVENMFAMAGWNMSAKNLRSQIASAIHLVVQMERQEDGKRRMVSICEINGMEGEIITMSEIFKFQRKGMDEEGNVIGHFTATGVVPQCHDQLAKKGMHLPFDIFNESYS
ncbi:Flp pilus assembly complex ATPase component TadA [Vibrio coralliilyticus]|uniref:CpaF family protein n=1 Tax=Vibrio TaxID=662 RepID=UPI000390C9B3|nr:MULTISPECIES: CpaF family protein [Vibrio]ERB66228.1 CpaF pilus assembly protein, ATPase CpaF [Vibrio coralliilyticus OCN008]NRF24512.1 Flp pilus assembly complex ATPase component TadA [Vibrio coralliilyticus]NRF78722.1 Flp pilus assembly complex ATPase component TadA [Vibrio coralliilyticus]QIJ82993.1 Flp pilus assembly complex ATPase component [Vibrio coralliilyticus OCN008]